LSRRLFTLILFGLLLSGAGVRAQPGSTVLFIATERLTDLVLGYPHIPNVARLGFGREARPWHAWFGGGVEMRPLVFMPDYRTGAKVRLQSTMLIGNRFSGKAWENAFAALSSFDRDGNGIVEGGELSDLYVWVDFDGDGTLDNREDSLRPAAFYYTAFDLRGGSKVRVGHARQGRIAAFSVLVPYASRIHLLELDVSASYASRHQAFLPPVTPAESGAPEADNPLTGQWRWKVTDAGQWKDATRPWGDEAGGQLMLAVHRNRIRGVVRTVGPHGDLINLPLEGTWRDGNAAWTSVSPLGLTRSEVRLESLYGYPVLRARSWSNRNGKVREWTWEARYDKPLD
jgi:hypothetical protein